MQTYSPAPNDVKARCTAEERLRQVIEDVPVKVSVVDRVGGRKFGVVAQCRIEVC